MNGEGPTQQYLEALDRELRVGRRYRRRVLHELAQHIEEAAEREQRLGVTVEEAQRRAIDRVGAVPTVADGFSRAYRRFVAGARERAVRLLAYLSAALVIACASFAPLASTDSDGHLGIEVGAALAAAGAVLLFDLSRDTSSRGLTVLAGVVGIWIAATVLLISAGDVLFCAQVLSGVLAAAALLFAVRRLRWRPRRREP